MSQTCPSFREKQFDGGTTYEAWAEYRETIKGSTLGYKQWDTLTGLRLGWVRAGKVTQSFWLGPDGRN